MNLFLLDSVNYPPSNTVVTDLSDPPTPTHEPYFVPLRVKILVLRPRFRVEVVTILVPTHSVNEEARR